ncbi:hypothetical protein RI367_005909 [Sorochytrium milnesiophthora]
MRNRVAPASTHSDKDPVATDEVLGQEQQLALIAEAQELGNAIARFYKDRRVSPEQVDQMNAGDMAVAQNVKIGEESFRPYSSFAEAISNNPSFVPIDDLTVFCAICQRTFKMSTKCNLRYIIRHEQALKHGHKLAILLGLASATDIGHIVNADVLHRSIVRSTGQPLPPSPFFGALKRKRGPSTDDSDDCDGRFAVDPRLLTGIDIPNSSSSSASRKAARCSQDESALYADTAKLSSEPSLSQSMKLKKEHLERVFKQEVEQSEHFEVQGPLLVYCRPCKKTIKLDRQRSPRTVLLHAVARAHRDKLADADKDTASGTRRVPLTPAAAVNLPHTAPKSEPYDMQALNVLTWAAVRQPYQVTTPPATPAPMDPPRPFHYDISHHRYGNSLLSPEAPPSPRFVTATAHAMSVFTPTSHYTEEAHSESSSSCGDTASRMSLNFLVS